MSGQEFVPDQVQRLVFVPNPPPGPALVEQVSMVLSLRPVGALTVVAALETTNEHNSQTVQTSVQPGVVIVTGWMRTSNDINLMLFFLSNIKSSGSVRVRQNS